MPTRSTPASPVVASHSVKPYLSLDHMVAFALSAAYKALHGWLRGQPHDELALLNRLTEELRYGACPEWPEASRSQIYDLRRQLFVLHHRGGKHSGDDKGTDAYGADLAITLNIFSKPASIDGPTGPSVFSKTALFQLKTDDNFRTKLERRQLLQPRVLAGHSFVLYADESKAEFRIQSTQKTIGQLGPEPIELKGEKPHEVLIHDWQTLAEWLVSWLTCQVGAFSTDGQRQIIEQALGRFGIWNEDVSSPFIRFRQRSKRPTSADVESLIGINNTDLPLTASWLVIDIYSSISTEGVQ